MERGGNRNRRRLLRNVFRREGEYWTIEYGGTMCRLRDSVGLHRIAYLLGRPGLPVPAAELVRAEDHDREGSAASGVARSTGARRSGVAGRRSCDGSAATGDSSSARVAATLPIRAAMRRIAIHNPLLFEHLKATIRTGTSCWYAPDPRITVRWNLAPRRSSNWNDKEGAK